MATISSMNENPSFRPWSGQVRRRGGRSYWTHRLPSQRKVRTVAVVPMMVTAFAVLTLLGTPRKTEALIGLPSTSVNEPSLVNITGVGAADDDGRGRCRTRRACRGRR